jgi:Arc/MetJ-type ribon-helix-helix transcriptional regulator
LQIEDPVRFKEDFDFVKNELTKLKKQMQDRKKNDDAREAKLRQKEEKRTTYEAKVVAALRSLAAWIPENLSLAGVKRLGQLSDKDRDKELIRVGPEIDLAQSGPIEQACLALQDVCRSALRTLLSKTSKLLSKQKSLSTELKDGIKIKSEIASDVNRLSKQVEAAVNERQSLQEELTQMEKALKERTFEA